MSANDSVWSSAAVGCEPSKTTRPLMATPGWSVSGIVEVLAAHVSRRPRPTASARWAGRRRAPPLPTIALIVYVPGATPVNVYVPSAPGCVDRPRRPAPASISVCAPAGTSRDREELAEGRRTGR